MNYFKKIIPSIVVLAGTFLGGLPGLTSTALESSCTNGLPAISQEEITAFKNQFTNKNPSYEMQTYSVSSLPDSVDLSTSPYFPPIGMQLVNNCTAWSTTYYQYTYAANRLNNITSTSSTTYSPRWVYNWLNGGNNTGIAYTNAYNLLMRQGCLTMEECPYTSNGSYDFSISTNTEAMVRALSTRLS